MIIVFNAGCGARLWCSPASRDEAVLTHHEAQA